MKIYRSSRTRRQFLNKSGSKLIKIATFTSYCLASPAVSEEPRKTLLIPPPSSAFLNTAELAAPDAQEIVLDLPSALHWSRHQRGQLGPWTYILFPNGTAKILSKAERPNVVATLACEAGVGCEINMKDGSAFIVEVGAGERPPFPINDDLVIVARYLAEWILAGTTPRVPSPPPTERVSSRDAIVSEKTTSAPAKGPDPVAQEGEIDAKELAVGGAVAMLTESGPPEGKDPVCSDQEPLGPIACTEQTGPLRADSVTALTSTPKTAPGYAGSPDAERSEPERLGPEPDAPSQWERFVNRFKVNCSLTSTTSLGHLNPDPNRRGIAKPRASLGCSARLTEKLSFRGALVGYGNPKDQEPWDPDYTYDFTYKVNEKMSVGYSNYSARFTDGDSPEASLFGGQLRVTYKLPALHLPNAKKVPCTASIGLPHANKESVNVSCRYAAKKKLSVSGTTYFYLPGEQDTYQPDFSYTASYRFNADWVLSYDNYSNNRWPWNKGEAPGPGFTGGSLSLRYKFKF
ncbi:hypothetical protein [Roseivivax sp. CAU 1753]